MITDVRSSVNDW